MTFRIGWLSPLSPASGVGTFSYALAKTFPPLFGGEKVDMTLLYPDHETLHDAPCRSVRIEDTDRFRSLLELFDLLVYNIGNNSEHHGIIFSLLRTHPGIVICHDYVYQHYLAGQSMQNGQSFASFAALLMKFGGPDTASYIARSRITSRVGKIRYAPWDSDISAAQPMSESLFDLGSALVVHSAYAADHAAKHFRGPIHQIGMPCDQKATCGSETIDAWLRLVANKSSFHAVSFGHIQSTKCLHLALEAIASSDLLRKKLKFTISGYVGDREYLDSLKEFSLRNGIDDNIRFDINVSDKRLVELRHDADIFINLRSPNTEGSSASLAEQLESGRPVVVFESGCYAELPREAAVKVAADGGSDAVRDALEYLILDPKRMPAIGQAGRTHAQKWTCASYGESLLAFAFENRVLLSRRGAFIGINGGPQARLESQDEAWGISLARARSAMRYLDGNILMVDPELVLRLPVDELCDYIAHVIFGVFDDPQLRRSLTRYFVCREGSVVYWSCVRFALIVEAVMASNEDARARLKALGSCFDIDFWEVVEALTFDQYVKAASLTFLGRMPREDELANADDSADYDIVAKRLALAGILGQVSIDQQKQSAKLTQWLEQPLEQQRDAELPYIRRDLNCVVGSAEFREHADLSGFYPQETDHAWTRGARGFIGLRLSPAVRKIEVLVRAVNATAENPSIVGLSSGTTTTEIAIEDGAPHLLAFDVSSHRADSNATVWLQLSTSHAGAPADHPSDMRVLGVCLMNLKVSIGAPVAARTQEASLPS